MGRPGLGDPVGVQDDDVVGLKHERLVAQLGVLEDAQERARPADRPHVAVGAQQQRQRMAGARQHEHGAVSTSKRPRARVQNSARGVSRRSIASLSRLRMWLG